MAERDDAIYGAAAGGGKFDPLWDAFLRVREQRDTLLAALEAVEWMCDGWGQLVCAWCEASYRNKEPHRKDCQRQAAIAAVKGEDDARGS